MHGRRQAGRLVGGLLMYNICSERDSVPLSTIYAAVYVLYMLWLGFIECNLAVFAALRLAASDATDCGGMDDSSRQKKRAEHGNLDCAAVT